MVYSETDGITDDAKQKTGLQLGSPRLKLLGTEGVGDVLQGVAKAVSEVIRRIDAPAVVGQREKRQTVSLPTDLLAMSAGINSQGHSTGHAIPCHYIHNHSNDT